MRRAQRRKYHYIYKTTCLLNNRYYYGMHSTDNLNDGYMGSGTRITRSLNKYGVENHKIEILEFLPSREKLKKRETEIVNEELINDPLCLNLVRGGVGGIFNEEHHLKMRRGASNWLKNKWKDPEYRKKQLILSGEKMKELHRNGKAAKSSRFTGKKHTQESILKMKKENSQKGEKNSQYGTCWITNEKESKKIYKGGLIPEGWRLGRKIKK